MPPPSSLAARTAAHPRHQRNHLGELPEYLGGLTSLRQLLLYDCGLTDLPASLGKLRMLQKLELGDNRLRALQTHWPSWRATRAWAFP